tara:strand:+ start:415 stop:636 length:222 start_codon:yes stop_codon:yes gene_type:complete
MLKKHLKDLMDHIWKTHMQTLIKRKKSLGISQIINDVLLEYYSDRGMEVPKWKYEKDPQWWIDYLEELHENGV